MTTGEVRAVIYISSVGKDLYAIVARTTEARNRCEAKAEELGAEIEGVYIEEDILRPRLERLLEDMSDGQTRYVISTESNWLLLTSWLRKQVERRIEESGATLVICGED